MLAHRKSVGGKAQLCPPFLNQMLEKTVLFFSQEALDTLAVDLRACQHLLQDQLTERRRMFPRFYFLSDDEVLEVLNLFASCSHTVRTRGEFLPRLHRRLWRKMFQGIQQVELGVGGAVPGLQPCFVVLGGLDEEIVLTSGEEDSRQPAPEEGVGVEVWLASLDVLLKEKLKTLTRTCLRDFEKGMREQEEERLLVDSPSQVSKERLSFRCD